MGKVKAFLSSGGIFSNSKEAFSVLERESFGEKNGEKVFYSFYEAIFLMEEEKMFLKDTEGKKVSIMKLLKIIEKKDKNFLQKYCVFKDLRKKGYIPKSALKFGADYRVYEKGKKVGEKHAKWLVSVFSEHDRISFKDLFAKNRVAHSTNKVLLFAVVDDEKDISYYEIHWRRL